MKFAVMALPISALLLTACNSLDGTYSPACLAFAGDSIVLKAGRYTWDKFTDEVVLDKDGNVMDQFPGFPAHGSYRLDNETLVLTSDAGEAFAALHLLHDEQRLYLLSKEQYEQWRDTGTHQSCVLVRGGRGGN